VRVLTMMRDVAGVLLEQRRARVDEDEREPRGDGQDSGRPFRPPRDLVREPLPENAQGNHTRGLS
jgi:hypothetical protein